MKKRSAAVLSLLFSLLLGGCGLITSADTLMSPPRLTEEQNKVYTALTKDIGSSVNLVYPRSGKYRSAYIIEDLDGDGLGEAVVFYKRPDPSDDGSSVRLNVLKEDSSGKWHSVYDHAGKGVSVDSVTMTSLGNSSRKYLIVGFNLLSSGDKMLQIYSFADNILNTEFTAGYTDYHLTDLLKSGSDDLVIIHGKTEKENASFNLVSDNGNGPELSGSLPLNETLVSIDHVTDGHISENTSAVYIDEALPDGSLTTEIIYCVDGKLRNPASVEGSGIAEKTLRPKGYYCTDVDGDGITEIPTAEPMPGYENETEQLMLTTWNVFENYSIEKKYSGWYSRSEGWCMMFPGRWKDLVTVRTDSASGAVIFSRYDSTARSGTELMRISAVNKDDTDVLLSMGYTLIESTDDTDFLVKLSPNTSESLVLTSTELKNNFFILR